MTDIRSLADLEGIKKQYQEELSNYTHQVLVCGGSGCSSPQCGEVKSALEKLVSDNQMQKQIAVIETGCMGLCAVGPVMVVMPDEVLYTEVNVEKVAEIFESHIQQGNIKEEYTFFDQTLDQHVTQLSEIAFLRDQSRKTLKNCGKIDPSFIEAYIAQDGYLAVVQLLEGKNENKTTQESAEMTPKFIVCNANLGDPKVKIDMNILEGDPHSVIEGMILTGYAMGANTGYIYIDTAYEPAIVRLEAAIGQAQTAGLLGKKILNTAFDFDLIIRRGAPVYMCGEETALLASLEGKRSEPKQKPPFPLEQGLFGRPTIVHPVESFARIPQAFRKQPLNFQYQEMQDGGTRVLVLEGNIVNKGMVEVSAGMSLGDIVYKIGGGIPCGKALKALQIGPTGGCIPKQFLNTALDEQLLSGGGGMQGSSRFTVIDEDCCIVDQAKKLMEFIQDQSCGKCLPCRVGTQRLLDILERITKGEGQQGDIELLEELGDSIGQSSFCVLGQTAPHFILSSIRYFREEYEEHIQDKHCRAGVCADLFVSPCQNACPAEINVPGHMALISEGKYADAYSLIKLENPFPAVCGRICTRPCESKCRRGQLDEPIAIADLKRFVADRAFEQGVNAGKDTVLPLNGKSIGIIGAGPSGLTCAYYLARLGYAVDVYEAHALAGGVLAYGIPEYRLPNDILAQEIELIKQVGVNIHLNTEIGNHITLTALREKHDALYIATGSQVSNKMKITGEELPGVFLGLDFLRDVNLGREVQVGKTVAVIGGGNTALDAARTALRMGASVKLLYRRTVEDMPADPREVQEAIEEGIEIIPLAAPVKVIGKDRVEAIECVRMELGLFDSGGRRKPIIKEGSNYTIQVDTVIPAVSQTSDLSFMKDSDVHTTQWETVITDQKTRMTNMDGVFAGGDVARGADVAIWAIADGKKAAVEIDLFLGGKGVLNKGVDVAFSPASEEDDLLDHERYEMEILAPETRKKSFVEIGKGYHKLKAIAESMRCLRCDRR